MKKLLKLLFVFLLCIILVGCGCSKNNENEKDNPIGSNTGYHFNYDKEMFDNPGDWPTESFFSKLPKAMDTVDDLTVVNYGGVNKDVYTITIIDMDYKTYKTYTDKLMDEGFMCSKAGYYIPDKESDLTVDTSQCFAENDGIYIKVYWHKSNANSYNFQMSVAYFDMDAK